MKKFSLLLCAILLSVSSFGQRTKIENNELKLNLDNGARVEVPITFSISEETIAIIKESKLYIKESKVYKEHEIDLKTNAEFEKFLKENEGIPFVDVFIKRKIIWANSTNKYKFKNPTSYSVVPNSKGMIYLSEDKNFLTILFSVQAQNGYGNQIISDLHYEINLTNGTTETTM